MDTESLSYKNAQRNFYNWTSKWFQFQQKETTMVPDVIGLVTLLQTIGFKICFLDFNNPNDVSLLQNGKRGLKVSIVCGNSGLRCAMELGGDCRCPKNTTEITKWEISGTGPNSSKDEIKEIGSDLLLPVSRGIQSVMGIVLNHFFYVVNAETNDCNQNQVKTPTRQTPQTPNFLTPNVRTTIAHTPNVHTPNVDTPNPDDENMLNQMTDNGTTSIQANVNVIAINSTVNLLSPETPMSPHRYRSLDTLTCNTIMDLPEPGILKKITPSEDALPALTCSSPNLSGPSQPSGTSSPVTNRTAKLLVVSKLKIIKDLVNDVLHLVDTDRAPSPMLNLDISKIKVSAESLPVFEAPKMLTLPVAKQTPRAGSSPSLGSGVKQSVKPLCRPPIRATSTVKTTPTVTLYQAVSTVSKVLENISAVSARMSAGAPARLSLGATAKLSLGDPAKVSSGATAKMPSAAPIRKPAAGMPTVRSTKYSHIKSTIPKTSCKK